MDPVPVPGRRLKQRVGDDLDHYACTRWPDLEEVTITWRGSYGYVRAWTTQTDYIQLCRIQYLGDPDDYAFALYQASTETYAESRLPTGAFTGTPREALDCALGLYLNDPSGWPIEPPKD
jgi:hypothetical protein